MYFLSGGRHGDYGEPARWNKYFEEFGTTHPSRTVRARTNGYKNDGRAPDTSVALLGPGKATQSASPKKAKNTSPKKSTVSTPKKAKNTSPKKSTDSTPKKPSQKKTKQSTLVPPNADHPNPPSPVPSTSKAVPAIQSRTERPSSPLKQSALADLSLSEKSPNGSQRAIDLASYVIDRNSCWLDTTLESVYRCVKGNEDDFRSVMTTLGTSTPLYLLAKHLLDRSACFDLEVEEKVDEQAYRRKLHSSQDLLRQRLGDLKITRTMYVFDSVWVRIHLFSLVLCLL